MHSYCNTRVQSHGYQLMQVRMAARSDVCDLAFFAGFEFDQAHDSIINDSEPFPATPAFWNRLAVGTDPWMPKQRAYRFFNFRGQTVFDFACDFFHGGIFQSENT